MEAGPGRARHRRVQVGVFEHDIRALAAQFQLDALEVAFGGFDDPPPGGGRTGKGNLAHIEVFGQRLPGGMAEARHHVDHAFGETDFRHQLDNAQGRQRGDFRRLDHDGVARRQRRAHFPAGEHQREVPRHDLPHHANRFALHVVEKPGFDRNHRTFDLVGHATKVTEARRRARHVEATGIADRVAGIEGFELRQFLTARFDPVRQFEQQASAFGGAQRRPGRERTFGGGDSEVDISGFGSRDAGDQRTVMG
ncbi:hypothetical protein D9M72_467420 [compost metagenome]